MKKKRGQTLAHWVERLPGADRIPFPLDRLSLYRIADLYKGYNPKKPESWTRAFDHQIYEWTLVDPTAPKPTTRRWSRMKSSPRDCTTPPSEWLSIGFSRSPPRDPGNLPWASWVGTTRTVTIPRSVRLPSSPARCASPVSPSSPAAGPD